LQKLNKKYKVITENHSGYVAAERTNAFDAAVKGSFRNPSDQSLVLNTNVFGKSKKELEKYVEKQIKEGYAMPCAENQYINYLVSHEFGHMLEHKLINQAVDVDAFNRVYKSIIGKGTAKDVTKARDFLKKETQRQAKTIFQEIVGIAKEKNPNFLISENISKYGKTNYTEAFAEIFANSQCGELNEFGNAMLEYLKRKGF
jgi:hypothetical protein